MDEELLKQLVDHQVEFSTGIGYPGAPSPDDVVRELREQGIELPPESPEKVEERVIETIESALKRICNIAKLVEIANEGFVEGMYLYRCYHPKLGTFFVYLSEEVNADSGKRVMHAKFTRNEAEALQQFSSDLATLLNEYDVNNVEELEDVLREKGLEVWYRI